MDREIGVTLSLISWRTERWAAAAALTNYCHGATTGEERAALNRGLRRAGAGRPIRTFDPIDECVGHKFYER